MTDNEKVQKLFINKSYVDMYLCRTGFFNEHKKFKCHNCKTAVNENEKFYIRRGGDRKKYLVCKECFARLDHNKGVLYE